MSLDNVGAVAIVSHFRPIAAIAIPSQLLLPVTIDRQCVMFWGKGQTADGNDQISATCPNVLLQPNLDCLVRDSA